MQHCRDIKIEGYQAMIRTHLRDRDRQRDERGVSPVVAVVLMLAITVTLVGVAIPMVFAHTDQVGDPAPDANFAFSYTEDVSTGETDSFGAAGDDPDPDADGKIALVLESGDSIPAEQLTVTGTASSGALGDSDEFEEGDVVSSGTRVTVWANRGDTVQLIWTAPEEDTSAILAEFTVRPTE